MTLPIPHRWTWTRLDAVDAFLRRPWVRCGIFLGALVLFWLLGSRTAHAL